MKLVIDGDVMFASNLYFSNCEAGNGRDNVQPGRYSLTTEYSEEFGEELPCAVGLGWIGADPQHSIVLGRVRTRDGLIPCQATVERLRNLINAAAERYGKTVELVVS